jgi:hypothetical protein
MVHAPEFYNRKKGFQFGRKKGEPKAPAGVKLEHRIGVQAPAEVVWEILQDVAAWPSWNPIVSQAEGTVRIGEKHSFTRTLPGGRPEAIVSTVVDWTPNELIHTKRSRLGGLVTVVAYWEIDTLAEENCIFSNGELFLGMLGPGQAKRLKGPLRRGYTAVCEAMKAKAEAEWRARSGAPTSGS